LLLDYSIEYFIDYSIEYFIDYSIEYFIDYSIEYFIDYSIEYFIEYSIEYFIEYSSITATDVTLKEIDRRLTVCYGVRVFPLVGYLPERYHHYIITHVFVE